MSFNFQSSCYSTSTYIVCLFHFVRRDCNHLSENDLPSTTFYCNMNRTCRIILSVTSMFDNSIKRSVQNEPFFQVWVPIVVTMFDNSIKRSVQNEPFFQVWVPIVLVRGPTMSNFKSHRKLFHNSLQFWCANCW